MFCRHKQSDLKKINTIIMDIYAVDVPLVPPEHCLRQIGLEIDGLGLNLYRHRRFDILSRILITVFVHTVFFRSKQTTDTR